MSKKFLIIGVGNFGRSVMRELYELGYEVVGCDMDEDVLEKVQDFSSYVVIGDAREDNVLEEMNVEEFDNIIVSMGDNFEAAVLIVAKLKKMGLTNVIAKANDGLRGEALLTIGAKRVIFPEEETGKRLARQIAYPGLLEFVSIDQQYSVMEMQIPEEFVGKSLIELDFRRKYNVTVIVVSHGIGDNKRVSVSPSPDEIFKMGDIIVVVGENKDLEKLRKKMN